MQIPKRLAQILEFLLVLALALSVGMGVVCSAGAESTVIIDFDTDPAGDEID
ncbi:MAG: hypothetical protein JRG96_09975, partial [Deltaproteobacteria bacterium]|nr:hypothetical protein [Deltaproteobacteria bacterium]